MALTEADLSTTLENGIDPDNPGQYEQLLKDLQGNILKGHGRDYNVHLFVQFLPDQQEAAKQWIADFAQNYVKSAQQQAQEAAEYRRNKISGGLFANFFLSCRGYDYLNIPPYLIPGDQPFRFGMKNENIRSVLGDPPVEEWETGFQGEIHALLLLADDDRENLLQTTNQITENILTFATIIHRDDGFILRNKEGQIIEHFGFVDGVSQPLFLKQDIVSARVNNANFTKWNPASSLDMLLVKDPNGQTEDSYGSYLVYRKLEQDVEAFREDVQKLAQTLNINEDLAGAFVVGRFQEGTPVTLSDIPTYAAYATNNFNYDDDTEGLKCPFHAHIRKTNPRGDTGRVVSSGRPVDEELKIEKKHRIARRAVSYGEDDPNNAGKTGSGLLFLCFQGNIENQFNFMQSRWANPKNFVKVNVGPDPLIGQPEGSQQWPEKWGEAQTKEYAFKLWVFLKGGEYFFAPSISSLTSIGQISS